MSLSADKGEMLASRGHIRLALGRVDDALGDFDKAIGEYERDTAGTWYGRARVQELKGDQAAAVADYRKALAAAKHDDEWSKHVEVQSRARLQAVGATVDGR